MDKILRCAIYIRVSTEEQHLNGLSLPAQKKALTEFANAYRKKRKLKNGGESIYIKYRCGNKFGRHGCAHFTEHKIEEYMLSHVSARLEKELEQYITFGLSLFGLTEVSS